MLRQISVAEGTIELLALGGPLRLPVVRVVVCLVTRKSDAAADISVGVIRRPELLDAIVVVRVVDGGDVEPRLVFESLGARISASIPVRSSRVPAGTA